MNFFPGACDLSLNHVGLSSAPAGEMPLQGFSRQAGVLGFADDLIAVSRLIAAHEDSAVPGMLLLHGVDRPAYGRNIQFRDEQTDVFLLRRQMPDLIQHAGCLQLNIPEFRFLSLPVQMLHTLGHCLRLQGEQCGNLGNLPLVLANLPQGSVPAEDGQTHAPLILLVADDFD